MQRKEVCVCVFEYICDSHHRYIHNYVLHNTGSVHYKVELQFMH